MSWRINIYIRWTFSTSNSQAIAKTAECKEWRKELIIAKMLQMMFALKGKKEPRCGAWMRALKWTEAALKANCSILKGQTDRLSRAQWRCGRHHNKNVWTYSLRKFIFVSLESTIVTFEDYAWLISERLIQFEEKCNRRTTQWNSLRRGMRNVFIKGGVIIRSVRQQMEYTNI